LAVANAVLMVSAWTNAMGAISTRVALIHGAHGKKGHDSPERNPCRAMAALKGILSGPHSDS